MPDDARTGEEISCEEKFSAAEKARIEAEERASELEARLCCMENGVPKENVTDVIALAKSLPADDTHGGDISASIASVLEKYPFFREARRPPEEPPITTGVRMAASRISPKDGVEAAFRRSNPTVRV